MNCSIVYCFTSPLSASFFFGSGVCFVINALLDTSGFCSGDGFWAEILETNTVKLRLATSNPAVAGRDKMKFDRHMAISCLMDFFPKEKSYCFREKANADYTLNVAAWRALDCYAARTRFHPSLRHRPRNPDRRMN